MRGCIIRHGESFPTSALLLEMCSDICGVTEWFLQKAARVSEWPLAGPVIRTLQSGSASSSCAVPLQGLSDTSTGVRTPHPQHRLTLPSSGGESVEFHLSYSIYSEV